MMQIVNTIFDVMVLALMAVGALVDIKEKIIPDWINGAIFVIGMTAGVVLDTVAWPDRIFGMLVVATFMTLVNLIIKDAFGGGDIKLLMATGMYYGLKIVLYGAIYGIILSGIYGIILLTSKKKNLKDRFALGPFLVVGIIFTWATEIFV